MTWFNPPTTKDKQRAYLLAVIACIERDAPHLVRHIAALRKLEAHMYNRVSPRRSRVASVPMSPLVTHEIRRLKALDPRMSRHVIAIQVGVNQGRVNNALIGVRT